MSRLKAVTVLTAVIVALTGILVASPGVAFADDHLNITVLTPNVRVDRSGGHCYPGVASRTADCYGNGYLELGPARSMHYACSLEIKFHAGGLFFKDRWDANIHNQRGSCTLKWVNGAIEISVHGA
jgi:hypothetical protein